MAIDGNMKELLDCNLQEYLNSLLPEYNALQTEMIQYAFENHIPIVEPVVGQFLGMMTAILQPKMFWKLELQLVIPPSPLPIIFQPTVD